MRGRRAVALAAVMTVSGATTAPAAGTQQNAARNPRRCYVAGMAFSAGSVARVGTMAKICAPDATWKATDQQTAGCIHASLFYATGTRLPVEKPRNSVLECLSDGTWSPVPSKSDPSTSESVSTN